MINILKNVGKSFMKIIVRNVFNNILIEVKLVGILKNEYQQDIDYIIIEAKSGSKSQTDSVWIVYCYVCINMVHICENSMMYDMHDCAVGNVSSYHHILHYSYINVWIKIEPTHLSSHNL